MLPDKEVMEELQETEAELLAGGGLERAAGGSGAEGGAADVRGAREGREAKAIKVSLNKSVRKDNDFGCDFRRQRNLPREEASRVYNRLVGRAATAEEMSRGGALRAVWLHEKDIAFLRAYCSLRVDETLRETDVVGISEAKKKALKNTDDFLAFGGKVASTGALEEAELLLQSVAPGPTWTVTDKKMKSAAAVASVESRIMPTRMKLEWMKRLAAAAEAQTWRAVKKEFAADRSRMARLGREGKLPEAPEWVVEGSESLQGSEGRGWWATLVTPVKGLLGVGQPVLEEADGGRKRRRVTLDAAHGREAAGGDVAKVEH